MIDTKEAAAEELVKFIQENGEYIKTRYSSGYNNEMGAYGVRISREPSLTIATVEYRSLSEGETKKFLDMEKKLMELSAKFLPPFFKMRVSETVRLNGSPRDEFKDEIAKIEEENKKRTETFNRLIGELKKVATFNAGNIYQILEEIPDKYCHNGAFISGISYDIVLDPTASPFPEFKKAGFIL